MAERNQILDLARGMAILLVVFGHAIQSANSMSQNDPLLNVIMTFWMPLFFLISGYASGYGSYHGFWSGFRAIALRLGLPYLVWAEIVYLISVCSGKVDLSIGWNCHALLRSGFWFLRLLFEVKLMFLVYQWAVRRLKDWDRLEVLSVLAAMAIGVILFLLGERPLFHYVPFFILGYVANRCRNRVSSGLSVRLEIVCAVFFLVGILGMNSVPGDSRIYYVLDKLMAIFGSGMVFSIARFLRYCSPVSRALNLLGKWSLAIYAVHWCLLFNPDLLHLRSYVSAGWNLYVVGFIGGCVWLALTFVFIICGSRTRVMSMAFFGQHVLQ